MMGSSKDLLLFLCIILFPLLRVAYHYRKCEKQPEPQDVMPWEEA